MKNLNTDLQYHIKLKKGDIGEFVILPGDPKRAKKISTFLKNAEEVGNNREYLTYTGEYKGEKVSVCSTGIGGPSAAIAMEELAKIGGKYFIRVGTCGGIDLDVKSGDIVIVSGAIRMDGTSKEYAPIEYPAISDYLLTNSLIKSTINNNNDYHIGVVQCKDSFYGQHSPEKQPISYNLINKWNAWKKLKVKASEMESSTLFVVADALGVKCSTVLSVIWNQEREKQGLSNIKNHNIDDAILIALNAIDIYIKNNMSI